MKDKLLSAPELAEMFNVREHTLYVWRQKKIGPKHIKISNQIRYRQSEVEKWLKNNEVQHDNDNDNECD